MTDWLPILSTISNFNNNLFKIRNICKEWYHILRYISFSYIIKFNYVSQINHLKQIYPNILIYCRLPHNIVINDDDLYLLKDIHGAKISWNMCVMQSFTPNLSILNKLHTVDISYCQFYTDVSMLKNIHTLIMRYCQNITDVSMMGKLHTLNMEGCNNITDVSNLTTLQYLNISNCKGITDISMLGDVKYLDIRCSTFINKFPKMNNIKKFYK